MIDHLNVWTYEDFVEAYIANADVFDQTDRMAELNALVECSCDFALTDPSNTDYTLKCVFYPNFFVALECGVIGLADWYQATVDSGRNFSEMAEALAKHIAKHEHLLDIAENFENLAEIAKGLADLRNRIGNHWLESVILIAEADFSAYAENLVPKDCVDDFRSHYQTLDLNLPRTFKYKGNALIK